MVFTLALITIYFMILMIAFLLACYYIHNSTNKSANFGYISRITTVHTEIFFYPISLFLLELMVKTINNELSIFRSNRNTIIASTMILIAFNLTITFSKILYCYGCIKDKHYISRKNSINLLGVTFLKMALIVLQSYGSQGKDKASTQVVSSVIISLVISLALSLNTYITLPEYDLFLSRVSFTYDATAVGICISQLFWLVLGTNNVALEVIYIIVPLWVFVSFKVLNLRISAILDKIDSIEHVRHFVFIESVFKELNHHLSIQPLKRKFSFKTLQAKWLMDNLFEEFHMEEPSKDHETTQFKESYRKFFKLFYEKSLEVKNNDPLVLLNYCSLILKKFNLHSKAYHICLRLKNISLKTCEQISFYQILSQLQTNLQETFIANSKANISSQYLYQNAISDESFLNLKNSLNEYSRSTVEYWKLLNKEEPDMDKLYIKAQSIQKQENSIQAFWNAHMEDFSTGRPVAYLLYGLFKSIFLNLPIQGKVLIERYNKLHSNKVTIKNMVDLANSDSATIMISGEKKHLGQILNCSVSVSQLFGLDQKSLTGKNVKTIMPRFFQERHDQFLMNYYETGISRLKDRKKLYGRDHSDNVFPISLTISLHPNFHKGIVYTGLVTRLPNTNEHILVRQDGTIEETTPRIRQLLSIDPYTKVNISDLCLEYSNFSAEMSINRAQMNFQMYCDEQREDHTHTHTHKESEVMTFKSKRPGTKSPMKAFKFYGQVEHMVFQTDTLNVFAMELLQDDPDIRSERRYSYDYFANKGKVVDLQSIKNDGSNDNTQITPSIVVPNSKSIFRTGHENIKVGRNSDKDNVQRLTNQGKIITNPQVYIPQKLSLNSSYYNYISKFHKNDSVDSLQACFNRPHPDQLRKVITLIFCIILLLSLVTAIVEHMVLNQAIDDIQFTAAIIKTSYDRLDALTWVWRFVLIYQARIQGLYPVVIADLDRFKLVVNFYRNVIENSNNHLFNIVADTTKAKQQSFFDKNVHFSYNSTNSALNSTTMDNYAGFNVLIDRVDKFYAKNHTVLLKGNNPEVSFILKNSINDLLIVSENTVKLFEAEFIAMVNNRKTILLFITILNVLITVISVAVILISFWRIHSKNQKFFKTLMTIRSETILLLIAKSSSFDRAVRDENDRALKQRITQAIMSPTKKNAESVKFKSYSKDFIASKIFMRKLTETLSLIFLLSCFTGVYFYRSVSSSASFDKLVTTNNRLAVACKARYDYNFVVGTIMYKIVFFGTQTYLRNQPTEQQIQDSLHLISSNQIFIDTYLDRTTDEFVDPLIETVFNSKVCPFLPDLPGGKTQINCMKSTNNEDYGLFAVNIAYYEELKADWLSLSKKYTAANAKTVYSLVTTISTPKFYTTVGAFQFIITLMMHKLDIQVSQVLETEVKGFTLEICLMLSLIAFSVWMLVKRVNNDDVIRKLLRLMPYEEVMKNKVLKGFMISLYGDKAKYLKKTN